MNRRSFLRAGLGGAGALALAACDSMRAADLFQHETKTPSKRPDLSQRQVLRLAGGDFGFPSPFAYEFGPGYVQMMNIYDPLLSVNGKGELVPWLASRYERDPSGLTYTFELRDNVRWHDGAPLTPEDVAFTFEYHEAQKKGGKLPLGLFVQPQNIARVAPVGPRSVEFRLKRPATTFGREVAAAIPIIPKHVWSRIDDASKAQNPSVLVGTGPYRLDSYKMGYGSYSYTANDEFFLGKPYVKRLEMVPVDSPINALLTGDIDAASPNVTGTTAPLLKRFRRDSSFGILEGVPDNFVTSLQFNLKKPGPLADSRFRQAVAYAIDRKDLVKRLLGGTGSPGSPGFLPPAHPYHAPSEQYDFSPARAARLLDELGYTQSKKGEIRKGPDGKQLRFQMLATPYNASAVEAVTAYLSGVGIKLDLKPVENFIPFTSMPRGDFEMAIVVNGGVGGDPDRMRALFSSRVPPEDKPPFGAHGYSNPEFDDLADRQLVTADENERKQLVARMQQIVAQDVPFLHLFYPRPVVIYRNGIFDGLSLSSQGGGPFSKEFYVTGARPHARKPGQP